MTDPLLDALRREIRRMSPDVRIDSEDIRNVLAADVLKREVLEGDKAEAARKQVAKSVGKLLRAQKIEPSPDQKSRNVGNEPDGISETISVMVPDRDPWHDPRENHPNNPSPPEAYWPVADGLPIHPPAPSRSPAK